ncbi:arginine--tRNA ligase [Candidatus Woesearchaeota archaeon]|nr:arginine--tRNA ligase [Candidatus Woesearchaeota archaeon]
MNNKEAIAKILAKQTKLKEDEILSILEVPSNPELGDIAFPCFKLSSIYKKNPIEIAKELESKIKITKDLEKIKATGPYLNFFLEKSNLAIEVIKKILKEKEKFGTEKNKQTIMIEFPSPNTNKPLHLGHLRNMSLGESVSRILEHKGNKIIRANLNNDRGVHICKSMYAYEKWGKNKTPESEKIKSDHLIGDYYVMFSKAAKENPALEEEAQKILQKWESGDKKTIALWKKMNKWAFDGFKETYKLFGIKHDKQYYESEIYGQGKELAQEGLNKNIFIKKDNAIIADLTDEKLGEKVILRADGTSIYITQDMYLAILKDKEYKLDGSIYVVANEQDYHFQVLFTILKKFGYKFTKNLHHLSYGMVELPEGRMKSREGTVVDADDLILETQKLAKTEIKKRFPKLSEKELNIRSLKIALSAIKFMLLKTDHVKNIIFNPNEAISFEGDTGPYIQYSYARASSILKKSKKKPEIKLTSKILKEKEILLIKKLAEFPEVIENAQRNLSPSIISNYTLELAHIFNEFYHQTKVLDSENEIFLLALVESFRIVCKKSLYLLGIETVEEM